MAPLRIFCGTDEREQVGLHVFCSSVWREASIPVSITPISHKTLSDGTNAFTLSRFLVPFLCGYRGSAIWADGSDMLCLADIAELWALQDPFKAVQVVKHDYLTRHPTKYFGQPNPDYPRKNWSSLMIINCAHYGWREIRPDTISNMKGSDLHRFAHLKDEWIGELPKEWNWIVGEPSQALEAKLVHFSIGIPVWYPRCDYAEDWDMERDAMNEYAAWVCPDLSGGGW